MPILTQADYQAIRAALDTDLDSDSLPDATIALSVYQDAADQDVLDLDPDAETRTGSELARVKRAAILFCAARLAPAVVRITSMTVNTRDLSYQRPTFKPDERAAELRQLAQAELNEILEPTGLAPSRPTMFAVVSGTRGK